MLLDLGYWTARRRTNCTVTVEMARRVGQPTMYRVRVSRGMWTQVTVEGDDLGAVIDEAMKSHGRSYVLLPSKRKKARPVP